MQKTPSERAPPLQRISLHGPTMGTRWSVLCDAAAPLDQRALHAELGFEELTDDFRMPGVVFSRDDGLLCRLVSRQDAEVVDLASRR